MPAALQPMSGNQSTIHNQTQDDCVVRRIDESQAYGYDDDGMLQGYGEIEDPNQQFDGGFDLGNNRIVLNNYFRQHRFADGSESGGDNTRVIRMADESSYMRSRLGSELPSGSANESLLKANSKNNLFSKDPSLRQL